jgi:hypothetical protein
VEAERAVLTLEPRGADRELEPAVRRVVDRDRLRGEQPERAIGEAGDEQTEAHARGDHGERRHRRVALEALARALAVHGLEVVEAPHAVVAEALGELRAVDDFREGHALRRDVQSDSHARSLGPCWVT